MNDREADDSGQGSQHADSSRPEAVELLFSYGTLQLEAVQQSTFGRLLAGSTDRLPGYRTEQLEITDPAVVATSGKTHHPIVVFTGNAKDGVNGTVFEVTPAELAHADAYEVADYRREAVRLASGKKAWVYVDARVQGQSPGPKA